MRDITLKAFVKFMKKKALTIPPVFTNKDLPGKYPKDSVKSKSNESNR